MTDDLENPKEDSSELKLLRQQHQLNETEIADLKEENEKVSGCKLTFNNQIQIIIINDWIKLQIKLTQLSIQINSKILF